jgi:hypothetical protein
MFTVIRGSASLYLEGLNDAWDDVFTSSHSLAL